MSLFDGMSCGQQALERSGIKVNNYYASEVDKHTIQITQKNYPNTIQLGCVRKIKAKDLPDKIDLVLAGPPCQDLSFGGKGKGLKKGTRSNLFFEFVRLLKECKPKYFLLENVRMKKEYLDVITEQVGGIEPILINSALVSAQNRQRYYWTNIPNVQQPEDRGIILKDVLEDYTDDVYLAGEQLQKNYYVAGAWRGRYNKDGSTTQKLELRKDDKTNALTTVQKDNVVVDKEMNWRNLTPLECERLQTVKGNYTSGVSDTQRYKMLGNGWNVETIVHILKGVNTPDGTGRNG